MQSIFLVSTVISCSEFHVILAPISVNMSQYNLTSLILGKFSIVQVPFINNVAGIIATAAFYAPLITTSPFRGVFPVITSFSKIYSPIKFLHNKIEYKILNMKYITKI